MDRMLAERLRESAHAGTETEKSLCDLHPAGDPGRLASVVGVKSKGLDTPGAPGGNEVDVLTEVEMQRNRGELFLSCRLLSSDPR